VIENKPGGASEPKEKLIICGADDYESSEKEQSESMLS
jgi:hypothetical protein